MYKTEYTEEEIIEIKLQIDKMSHYEMCRLWRNAPYGHPFFDGRLPFAEYYEDRLFNQLGGFTSEISKKIG